MKKTLVIVLALVMILLAAYAVVASDPIKIVVNGKEIVSDVAPQIIEGRTMVPIRVVAEALDLDVKWDSTANTVFITSKTSPTQPTQPTEPTQQNAATISKGEFDQITTGMTYEQVTAIVGGPGEVSSESEVLGIKTTIYSFKGEGSIGANAVISFQDGKVLIKSQVGLK